jgi:hypothetical protein
MIKDVINAIGNAAGKLFTHWGALLISLLLYAGLLLTLYLFFTTREATFIQVLLSLVILPLAALVLFFAWQAMSVSYVRIGVGAIYLLRRALKDSWKLLVMSLPLALLAWLIVYLLGKAEVDLTEEQKWKLYAVQAARWLLLYFALPLMAIHWWIAAVREGLSGALKSSLRNLVRAFAPRSALIYAVVVAVFGGLVYLLLFVVKTQFGGEWTELTLFSLRLALAAALIFIGWMLAVGALAELTAPRLAEISDYDSYDTQPLPHVLPEKLGERV